jgi:hypothetical protein
MYRQPKRDEAFDDFNMLLSDDASDASKEGEEASGSPIGNHATDNETRMYQHIHPESVAGLSFQSTSVHKSANYMQENSLYFYNLISCIVRTAMYSEKETPLPNDVNIIINPFKPYINVFISLHWVTHGPWTELGILLTMSLCGCYLM